MEDGLYLLRGVDHRGVLAGLGVRAIHSLHTEVGKGTGRF